MESKPHTQSDPMSEKSRESAASASILVWFRDDLRVADHPALAEAVRSKRPVIALYVLDDTSGLRPLGGAARWWLAGSLRALAKSLKERGASLVLRRGNAADIVAKLADEHKVSAVHWNRRYDAGAAHDDALAERLAQKNIAVRTFQATLLHEPPVLGKSGQPLSVFTPFWRTAQAKGAPRTPLSAPRKIESVSGIASDNLDDWELEPTAPDWATEMDETWTRGEIGAQQRLGEFLDEELSGYATQRDRPDLPGTSRLSPHLRFGEVSPFQVWHAAQLAAHADRGKRPRASDAEKFLSELGWREFCYHLLQRYPDIAARNIDRRFDRFPWRKDVKALDAWQKGETGYPIVDAGMRQLWRTGWMHNRVRMVVASFLVKHLLIDWRLGEQWFWDTLVDADPANNPASWQWVAGCGADAAPYFRVFNPMLQAEKFDPRDDYVRTFVPEANGAGGLFGKSYPEPIVDHRAARERALQAFASLRS
ncbi:Deoxyribodipyrimidine photolyase [Rhodoplanes sp. Z2-YC6860]|nr:Deoxyribodipyrimidine photolyase [Rhodoplanes sp. Z2-YC6860]